MIALCVAGLVFSIWNMLKGRLGLMPICLFATAALALIAERNFVLYMPVLLYGTVAFSTNHQPPTTNHFLLSTSYFLLSTVYFLLFFLLGLWARSLLAYDISMIASQRVPVDAAAWMAAHPHEGHLFNDDLILKTADFFERYLRYADDPALFMHDADSLHIGRAIFPLRYYARWGSLLSVLEAQEDWNVAYRDSLYIVLNHDIWNFVSER